MILILAVIVFLFSLFALSKDDFIFLRKNVTLQEIFDTAFFVGVGALFFARVIFVLTHFSKNFLNPLVFFIIPYFPGLASSGLLIGGSIVLYGIAMRKKLPLGKFFDVFSLSLLPAATIMYAWLTILYGIKKDIAFVILFGAFALLFLVCFFVLQKVSDAFSWKDGAESLFALFLLTVCLLTTGIALAKFTLLFSEFPYFLSFFFFLFLAFVIKTFRKTRE